MTDASITAAAEETDSGVRMEFLLAAIEDVRDVIRVIDTKVGALLVGLAIPLSTLASIWSVCGDVLEKTSGAGGIAAGALFVVFALAWAISIFATLQTLLHADNPAEHITGETPSGVFYSPRLFRLSLWAVLLPGRSRSQVPFARFLADLPRNRETATRELAFEFMKLVYIRTLKMKRAQVAYFSFYAWIVSGGVIWLMQLAL